MQIISHRGNLCGPVPTKENSPIYINKALEKGFDCEIDVWLVNDKLYLGHDEPIYEINESFLYNEKFWCHAKNLDALSFMLKNNIHCFWHQEDDYTVTSKGYIWTHQNSNNFLENSVACRIYNIDNIPKNIYGICTDFPSELIKNHIQIP